jgi:hypothetical protein
MAGRAVAARAVHLLQDRRGGRQRQPGAAIVFRDQRGEVAGLRQRVHELGRIAVLAVELAPVFAGKPRAQLAHGVADVGVVFIHHSNNRLLAKHLQASAPCLTQGSGGRKHGVCDR